jgi:hypothetical protein
MDAASDPDVEGDEESVS